MSEEMKFEIIRPFWQIRYFEKRERRYTILRNLLQYSFPPSATVALRFHC